MRARDSAVGEGTKPNSAEAVGGNTSAEAVFALEGETHRESKSRMPPELQLTGAMTTNPLEKEMIMNDLTGPELVVELETEPSPALHMSLGAECVNIPVEYDLFELAGRIAELAIRATQLDPDVRHIRYMFIDSVTHVVIYHRIADGIDEGEISIASRSADTRWIKGEFVQQLTAMNPGDVLEHDFSLGRGSVTEHFVDTYIGEFEVVRRLGDSALVRRVAEPAGQAS